MELAFLIIYILALSVLFIFGLHGLSMVYHYAKLRPHDPDAGTPARALPRVTVQLPIYNELYVAERLVESVCALDYPIELLEIQLLDDSTDETGDLLARIAAEKRALGFAIEHLHRGDRSGFKAGALRAGLARATGEYIAI